MQSASAHYQSILSAGGHAASSTASSHGLQFRVHTNPSSMSSPNAQTRTDVHVCLAVLSCRLGHWLPYPNLGLSSLSSASPQTNVGAEESDVGPPLVHPWSSGQAPRRLAFAEANYSPPVHYPGGLRCLVHSASCAVNEIACLRIRSADSRRMRRADSRRMRSADSRRIWEFAL